MSSFQGLSTSNPTFKGSTGQGKGTKKPEKRYCIGELLDSMEQVESGGKCDAKSPNWDLGTFGPLQISKGYFDIANKRWAECGGASKCKRYPWIIEEGSRIPSVMCKDADSEARARKWSRCVVISYMLRYANRAGKGNIPGKTPSLGARSAPHNDSPWMNAIVIDTRTGLTDHTSTAKNREGMTAKDKRKNGMMHGDWDRGGKQFGGGKIPGAMDRLCNCQGTLKDCELVSRLHNGGSIAGNYGDLRGPKTNSSSLERWDNTTNYWNKIKGILKPVGK